MKNTHQELADKIVNTFKATLDESARQRVSAAQFDELAIMIREALSEELETAVELVEEVARTLRTRVQKPEIGL